MSSKPRIVTRISKDQGAEDFSSFRFDRNHIRLVEGSEAISQYRLNAFQVFQSLPLPDTKQEAWRRTDLRPLKPGRFALNQDRQVTAARDAAGEPADESHDFAGSVSVSPNSARYALDAELERQGVLFMDLRSAEITCPEVLEKYLGSVVKPEEGKFAALSAAFAANGVFLYVPKNVILDKPLQCLFSSAGESAAFVTHLVIYLDENSSATLFQEYNSSGGSETGFHSGLVEIELAAGANFKFVEIQSWNQNVYNITHERVHVGKDANLDWIIGALGSRLTKSFVDLDLVGEGAVGKVSGFSFTNGHQHLDYDTQQNHKVPHTTSDLLYKVALTDKSRSVWQGMIYVAPGAEKADGYQANRNLLLDSNARADSIPGLEILADDVRCTHGATVGELDFEEVFYLMSRGIPRNEAEKMLVEGFFDPIMQRIPFENVRARFFQAIHNKLKIQA